MRKFYTAEAVVLRYKFKHAGMSVREQNMQALYMPDRQMLSFI